MAGAIFFILFLESFATVCNTFSIFFFQIYFIKRSFKLTTISLFGFSVILFSFCCQTDRQSTLLFGLLQFLFFSSVGCGLCVCVVCVLMSIAIVMFLFVSLECKSFLQLQQFCCYVWLERVERKLTFFYLFDIFYSLSSSFAIGPAIGDGHCPQRVRVASLLFGFRLLFAHLRVWL